MRQRWRLLELQVDWAQRKFCVIVQPHLPPLRLPCKQHTADAVRRALRPHFVLERRTNEPFLIREHLRKYAWGVSDAMV